MQKIWPPLVLGLIFFIMPAAQAARTIRVSSYVVRYIFTFEATCPSNGTNKGVGQLSYLMSLANLSAIPQTVTISVLPGSTGGVVTSDCGAWSTMRFGHCGPGSATLASSITGLAPVTFTVPPNGTTSYTLALVASAMRGTAGNCSTGQNHGDASLAASFEIKVNEDRGALQGSLVPMIDAPLPGPGACGITTPTPPYCNPILQDQRSTVPILLNGGRPF